MSGTAITVHCMYLKQRNMIGEDQTAEETKIRIMKHIRVHAMRVVTCKKMKVVALQCSFQNLLESCSKVLPL